MEKLWYLQLEYGTVLIQQNENVAHDFVHPPPQVI